ncbi:MAG: A24 family peptidase [Alphaproteobacteria bacterium]
MGGAIETLSAQPASIAGEQYIPTLASFGLPLTVQATILLAAAGIVTWAAISDLRSNVIPNSANVGLFVLWTGWVVSGADAAPWYSLAIGAAVFLLGAVLFHFRQMGGGDVKLLTVLSIWAGPAEVLPFLLQVAFAGGVLTAAWIVNGRFVAPALGRFVDTGAKRVVPYGVAIAAGAYLLYARLWI